MANQKVTIFICSLFATMRSGSAAPPQRNKLEWIRIACQSGDKEDRTELVNTNNSVNDQKENDLNCAGCIYLDEECAPCASCVRSRKYADYYRQASENDWLEYQNPSDWRLNVADQNGRDYNFILAITSHNPSAVAVEKLAASPRQPVGGAGICPFFVA